MVSSKRLVLSKREAHTLREAVGEEVSIPFMVRRARLIRGETQAEFANQMGVGQAAVSRWERAKMEPSPDHLREIHRIVSAAEPCHSRDYIKAAPTIKYVCQRDNFLKPVVISRGLAQAAGFDPADVIRNPEPHIKEGIRQLNKAVQSDARWELGDIAFFEARFYSPMLGERVRSIGAPLAESNLALIEMTTDADAEEEDFWIKLTPFE